jgi:hypothetical protein
LREYDEGRSAAARASPERHRRGRGFARRSGTGSVGKETWERRED